MLQINALSTIDAAGREAGSADADVQDEGVRPFANRERLGDDTLREAVRRAERGLVDADLGGGVIKQRVPRQGGGRSGGYRTIVLFRRGERSVFVYGFAKSDRENLRPDELAAFRLLADVYLGLDQASLEAAQSAGAIIEVK